MGQVGQAGQAECRCPLSTAFYRDTSPLGEVGMDIQYLMPGPLLPKTNGPQAGQQALWQLNILFIIKKIKTSGKRYGQYGRQECNWLLPLLPKYQTKPFVRNKTSVKIFCACELWSCTGSVWCFRYAGRCIGCCRWGDMAGAFKSAHAMQSKPTRKIVAEMKS